MAGEQAARCPLSICSRRRAAGGVPHLRRRISLNRQADMLIEAATLHCRFPALRLLFHLILVDAIQFTPIYTAMKSVNLINPSTRGCAGYRRQTQL